MKSFIYGKPKKKLNVRMYVFVIKFRVSKSSVTRYVTRCDVWLKFNKIRVQRYFKNLHYSPNKDVSFIEWLEKLEYQRYLFQFIYFLYITHLPGAAVPPEMGVVSALTLTAFPVPPAFELARTFCRNPVSKAFHFSSCCNLTSFAIQSRDIFNWFASVTIVPTLSKIK